MADAAEAKLCLDRVSVPWSSAEDGHPPNMGSVPCKAARQSIFCFRSPMRLAKLIFSLVPIVISPM